MECSSGEKFISMEVFLLEHLTVRGFTVISWTFLSHMLLGYAYLISDQKTLLLVSLGKGSKQ